MSLNLKQKAFCEHYVACLNATESAKRAGYSEKTAYSQGQRLLKHVEVKKYIEKVTQDARSRRIATIDEVLEYLSKTMTNAELPAKERTRAAQILLTTLQTGQGSEEGSGEVKIVIERRVMDLSKDKKKDGNN